MPNFSFSFSLPVVIVLLAAALAATIAWFFYRTTIPPVPPRTKALLITLRTLSLFALLVLLAEPLVRLTTTTAKKPVLAILFDDSKSMTINDAGGDRKEIYRRLFADMNFTSLVPNGEVRFYAFGSSLRPLASGVFDSLALDKDATNISAALRGVAEERERLNLAALVLVTDGNYNLGQNPLYDAERIGLPIFPIGIGDTTEQKDVLITKVLTNELVYAETEVPVDVTVKSAGYRNETVDVSLHHEGREVSRARITLQEGTREYSVRLSYIPLGEGVKRYTVRISSLPGELTTANNQRVILARVLKSKLHILLLAGVPSPDLSIVKYTLREDKNLTVSSLTLKTPSTFYERDNPQTLLDSADCLVLIGFPLSTTSETIVEMVRSAVARRTVPIFFIDGQNVDERKLEALSTVLPFTIVTPSVNEHIVFAEPVPAQRNHPIMATGSERSAEAWKRLPPIFKTQAVVSAKPEAVVLATARVATVVTNDPLILLRNINRQKSLAVVGYGIWRWRLMAQGNRETEHLMATFLTNGIRWLTTRDDARPVKVTPVKPAFAQGEQIEFVGEVYDASANPIDNAMLRVTARLHEREFETVLRPLGNGRYDGSLEGLGEGDYTFTASATHEGQQLGEDRGRFSVGEVNLEYQETRMNIQLLRQMAARSGGAFVMPREIVKLPSLLAERGSFAPREVQTTEERELWNWPYVLGLVVALLGVEWFMRKSHGML